jgi:hypothetical protein
LSPLATIFQWIRSPDVATSKPALSTGEPTATYSPCKATIEQGKHGATTLIGLETERVPQDGSVADGDGAAVATDDADGLGEGAAETANAFVGEAVAFAPPQPEIIATVHSASAAARQRPIS